MPAILVPEDEVARLLALAADAARSEITVDLPAQTIVAQATGERIAFAFDPVHKDMLVRGIERRRTRRSKRSAAIEAFERAYFADNPWLA